jgi:hypothetical protein
MKINVREYRRASKNRKSRETGNIGYTRTRHRMKINVREYRRGKQK